MSRRLLIRLRNGSGGVLLRFRLLLNCFIVILLGWRLSMRLVLAVVCCVMRRVLIRLSMLRCIGGSRRRIIRVCRDLKFARRLRLGRRLLVRLLLLLS